MSRKSTVRTRPRPAEASTRRPAEPVPPQPLAGQMFAEAISRHQLGQLAEAEALYRAILAIQPAHAGAGYNLGIVLQTLGRQADAVGAYRHVIAVRPDFADAYSNLGTALQDLGQLDEAVAIYRQAIALKPDFAMAFSNLGAVLKQQGKFDEAVTACRAALAIQPDYDSAYANLGAALLEQGDVQAALEISRRAVVAHPGSFIAWCNLGACNKTLNRLDEAEVAYRQAVALRPDFPEAHFSLAQILLLKGELTAAWPEYEWRWKLREYGWLRALHGEFAQPRWGGEALHGKTLLVYAEQGLGDTIQFVRFLPAVAARGGRIVLAVQPPLMTLLSGLDGVTVVPLDQPPLPPFDVHAPLLSLPGLLGTSLDTIPAPPAYLQADPARTGRWRARIGGSGFKVGIVWAGNPSQRGDRFRSPRLPAMMPLFAVPGVDFVALQLGAGRADLACNPLPPNVLDLGPEIADFADTAAIMTGLDLVITSCTAPLHLAGALGIPVWGILPFAPHFFWLLDRPDSPWYPALRLYRQDRAGHDWSGVIGRAAAALAELAVRNRPPANTIQA
jgi:tetratricopeptide (TPR) repeat protein